MNEGAYLDNLFWQDTAYWAEKYKKRIDEIEEEI